MKPTWAMARRLRPKLRPVAVAGAALVFFGLAGCTALRDGGDPSTPGPDLMSIVADEARDTDRVPASVAANLPGDVRPTKRLHNATLPLGRCAEGELTPESTRVQEGWITPGEGLTAFVEERICDVAIRDSRAVHCGGRTDRFGADFPGLERSGGEMTACSGPNAPLAFVSVVVPDGAQWLAVQRATGWDVYRVGSRPVVRVLTAEGLTATGDKVTLSTRALAPDGNVLSDKVVTGAVAG